MIPLFSAAAANAGLDLVAAVERVLNRHWYVLGEEVTQFEREFAAYNGAPHCVSVANGTDALEIGLRAVGCGTGDKVVTVANAGFYSSTAIRACGATPLYVDVDEHSLTMSPAAFERALADAPRAVVVTHLYGRLADIETIVEIAGRAGIPVIEDCAQAHGARRNGRIAGSFGDIGCYSFYPTKNLGAVGDGGAIVTRHAALDERLRRLRQYGWQSKYQVVEPGGRNSRLDEIQAAILREKLPHLDAWNEQRRSIAARYNAAFAELPDMRLPAVGEDFVAHLYVVRVAKRDAFQDFLRQRGVASDIHYPIPDHRQHAYAQPSIAAGGLPATDTACGQLVSLPCFPGLRDDELATVIAAVQAWFSR